MTVHELTREQLIHLKVVYLFELEEEGILNEVLYNDPEDDSDLSWGEIANADNLVPDDVIFEQCGDISFTHDDFFIF